MHRFSISETGKNRAGHTSRGLIPCKNTDLSIITAVLLDTYVSLFMGVCDE